MGAKSIHSPVHLTTLDDNVTTFAQSLLGLLIVALSIGNIEWDSRSDVRRRSRQDDAIIGRYGAVLIDPSQPYLKSGSRAQKPQAKTHHG